MAPPLSFVTMRTLAPLVPCPETMNAEQLSRSSTLHTIDVGAPPTNEAVNADVFAKSVSLDDTAADGVIDTAGGGPDEYAVFSAFAASRMWMVGTVLRTLLAFLMWIAATVFRTLEASRIFIS
jgi:hypothetical protein